MSANSLIQAGALRQFTHNDGSDGMVFAYDKLITDRVLVTSSKSSEQRLETCLIILNKIALLWHDDKLEAAINHAKEFECLMEQVEAALRIR